MMWGRIPERTGGIQGAVVGVQRFHASLRSLPNQILGVL